MAVLRDYAISDQMIEWSQLYWDIDKRKPTLGPSFRDTGGLP
jgi:hypothetical protein